MAPSNPLPEGVAEVIRLRLADPLPAARVELLNLSHAHLREAMISLVARHTDPLRVPFQDIDPACGALSVDALGNPGDPWLVSGGLLDAIGPLPGWSVDELRRLLRPISSPYAVFGRAEPAIRALLRQLDSVDREHIEQLEFEVTAFAGALSRPNAPIDPELTASAAAAAWLPERQPIDEAIDAIAPCDDWGVKCLVALRHSQLAPDTAREVMLAVKSAGGSGAAARWQARLNAIADSGDAESVAIVGSMLATLTETIVSVTWQPGWLPFLPWAANERLAAGAVGAYGWWLARVADSAERADAVELCQRLAWWGARWDGNRPVSGPIARTAATALGDLGGDAAVVALHRLQERFGTRPGLGKQLAAALDRALAAADRSLVQILTASGPWFGLDHNGTRIWSTDRGTVELTLRPPDVVVTEHTAAPFGQANHDEANHADAIAEANAIGKSAEQELGVLLRRFDTALRDGTTYTIDEYAELVINHPVSGSIARGLIWEFASDDHITTGVPDRAGALDGPGASTVPADFSFARLWHPMRASDSEIDLWKRWLANRPLPQPLPQIERDVFRLADFRPVEDLVAFRQVEGILRSRGWRVHRLDRWDGGQQGPASRDEPSSGFRVTVQVTIDSSAVDAPILCSMSAPHIDCGRLEPNDPRVDVLVSEALRDLALVSSKARSGRSRGL